MTTLWHYQPWINRAGYAVYNWLETLVLRLPPLTNNSNNLSGFFSYGKQLILSYFSYPELYTQSLNQALDTVLCLTLMVTPSYDQLWFGQVGGSIMGGSFFSSYIFTHRF
jgi:hypothetical protein